MKPNDLTSRLYDKATSLDFYKARYAHGYMDQWPIEKQHRVFEVVRGLNLPAQGNALDFGCGNGVFTEVIRRTLPGWTVYGTDISETAIRNAAQRYPKCRFFVLEDGNSADKKFNFLFTHHVLEHVYSLTDAIQARALASQYSRPYLRATCRTKSRIRVSWAEGSSTCAS